MTLEQLYPAEWKKFHRLGKYEDAMLRKIAVAFKVVYGYEVKTLTTGIFGKSLRLDLSKSLLTRKDSKPELYKAYEDEVNIVLIQCFKQIYSGYSTLYPRASIASYEILRKLYPDNPVDIEEKLSILPKHMQVKLLIRLHYSVEDSMYLDMGLPTNDLIHLVNELYSEIPVNFIDEVNRRYVTTLIKNY